MSQSTAVTGSSTVLQQLAASTTAYHACINTHGYMCGESWNITFLCVCRVVQLLAYTKCKASLLACTAAQVSSCIRVLSHRLCHDRVAIQAPVGARPCLCLERLGLEQDRPDSRNEAVGHSGGQHPDAHWGVSSDLPMCELQVVPQ